MPLIRSEALLWRRVDPGGYGVGRVAEAERRGAGERHQMFVDMSEARQVES